jgi:ribosomal-protein-alanine N-acetyltransferase
MTHKGTVTLETERLILRRFTLDDVDAMFKNWANDPEVTKYLTWQPHGNPENSREIIKSWIELYDKPDFYSWAIVLKSTGEAIGSISIVHKNDDIHMVHIGYCIGKALWRKGITSEALCQLVRFFFEDVGVNRIESRHDPRNPNSGAVMRKSGLVYEGTLRQADKNNQEGFCDACYYAILADDYFRDKT